jgi:hypothetical protein
LATESTEATEEKSKIKIQKVKLVLSEAEG